VKRVVELDQELRHTLCVECYVCCVFVSACVHVGVCYLTTLSVAKFERRL